MSGEEENGFRRVYNASAGATASVTQDLIGDIVTGQADTGIYTDATPETFVFDGGTLVLDLSFAQGGTYRVTLERSTEFGECEYALELGDDIVYEG